MCDFSDISRFLVFAKACSCSKACVIVSKKNYGHDVTALMDQLLLLDSYIDEIESYIYSCCKNFYKNGIKFFEGKKIIMSSKNSLYLESIEGKIEINSDSLNCLTEDQICEIAGRIKRICSTC